MRKEKKFKHGTFPVLQRRLHKMCQQRGHIMVHATTWRWRQKNVNEMFYCRHCGMQALIQFHPPMGYAQLHGTACCVSCTYDETQDRIVNPQELEYDGGDQQEH